MAKLQSTVATALAALVLVLVIANIVLLVANRQLQAQVTERATFIQQSVQLEGLLNQMVSALADLSARTGDQQIRELLNAQGIRFEVKPPDADAPAAGAAGEVRR